MDPVDREPHYKKGQLVWHQENQEVLRIVQRLQNLDHDSIVYRVSDPTNTAYEYFSQEDLRAVSVDLPIAVLHARKPASILDLDELVEKLQNLTMYSEINLEDVTQEGAEDA